MRLKRILTPTVAAGLLAAATPAAAAAAPVQVTSFSLSPTCVAPGHSVTATATIQNTTYAPQSFYAQEFVSEFGYTIQQGSVMGAYALPSYASVTQSQTTQLSSTTPYGYYTVNLGVGPSSSNATGYGSRGTGLTVSPFC
jgi:hypothetical protein